MTSRQDIDSTKQQWFVEMLEAYLQQQLSAPSEAELAANSMHYNHIKDSAYIAEVINPSSGDDYLTVRIMDNAGTLYDANAESVIITSKRVATLEQRGMDFVITHDTDLKMGTIITDLPIHNLRAISEKDAFMMYKMFDKIDNAVNTGLSWVL